MKKIRFILFMVSALLVLQGFTTQAFAKKKVKIVYVEWACATAASNVMKAVIEKHTDKKVELTPVSASAMYAALADQDQDALVCAWLPVTHQAYVDRYKKDLVDLGPNFEQARIGLVVPKYVTINSIAEMNKFHKKFKGGIVGIDPGAGVMAKTESAIKEYNLDKIELMPSSGPIMTASLKNKYKHKEWVAVTGWVPHWKFAKFDLKFLEDPKEIFGKSETINTIARKGLKKDMPKVYSILDNFKWTSAQIGEVMAMNAENGEAEENAVKWVEKNPEIVKNWIK